MRYRSANFWAIATASLCSVASAACFSGAISKRATLAGSHAPIRRIAPIDKRRMRLPNGWRLSCGAKRESSQTKFYHTAGRTFTRLGGDGRRQLQARVRPLARVRYFGKARNALSSAVLSHRQNRASKFMTYAVLSTMKPPTRRENTRPHNLCSTQRGPPSVRVRLGEGCALVVEPKRGWSAARALLNLGTTGGRAESLSERVFQTHRVNGRDKWRGGVRVKVHLAAFENGAGEDACDHNYAVPLHALAA